MPVDAFVLAIAALGVGLIAFMRGAFGGGFAVIGIPLLSLAMDPIAAGALLAPLFIVIDVVALRYWKARHWSRADLLPLLPALVIGIGAGYLLMRVLDRGLVAIAIALITLAFAALFFAGGGQVAVRPRSIPNALLAGASSGVTTMVAHAGGPPLALYLLRRGLPKEVYAGTTSLFFTVGNAIKMGPWLTLARSTSELWTLMALCLPVVPLGVWIGWRLHHRLDQRQLYRICYGLLVVTALKLLWDGVSRIYGE
jgi:uncharacterized protein